jgi:hypothetical protein
MFISNLANVLELLHQTWYWLYIIVLFGLDYYCGELKVGIVRFGSLFGIAATSGQTLYSHATILI